MGLLFGFIAALAAIMVTKFALGVTGFLVGGIFMVRFIEAIGL